MNEDSSLLAAVLKLPERDRLEIAMAILDDASLPAWEEDEIVSEAVRRQDEMESGAVQSLSYEELVQGLAYRPRSMSNEAVLSPTGPEGS